MRVVLSHTLWLVNVGADMAFSLNLKSGLCRLLQKSSELNTYFGETFTCDHLQLYPFAAASLKRLYTPGRLQYQFDLANTVAAANMGRNESLPPCQKLQN